jgi:precorrin-3B C17-methyltransferase
VSQSRPWQFTRAMERLAGILPPATPVVIGRAVGRADEKVTVTTLDRAGAAEADMATLVIVGSRETRLVQRAGLAPLVYTPRSTAVVNA